MGGREIIQAARRGFDGKQHDDEYRHIHSDAEQLEGLLGMLEPREGESYLDLGTGNGYVAFELAKRHPEVRVRGLDIAEESIRKDAELAKGLGLGNLDFLSYEGLALPFAEGEFAGAVSRYALHHFPDIRGTLGELGRVIKEGGFFLLSDPRSFDEDAGGFADKFQSLLPDGHVHFYRRAEIEALFAEFRFVAEREFPSSVRYPRKIDDRYRELLARSRRETLDLYGIQIEGDEIYIKVEVMNLFFRRKA
jgi:SAM-dependent methyltransferase